jgi:hypothetical protein
MGIRDKPIAPASPWQNGFAERLIGSIRHECLDHIIVLGDEHLLAKGCADLSSGSANRPPMFARDLGWTSSSIRSDLVFGTHTTQSG